LQGGVATGVVGSLLTAGEGDDVVSPVVGGRFVPRRPFKLGRDAPRKLAARGIREWEVRSLLESHVIVDVVEHRSGYVLRGRVAGRVLMAVVADDELDTTPSWSRCTNRTRHAAGYRR
jgi:hypothetical protein